MKEEIVIVGVLNLFELQKHGIEDKDETVADNEGKSIANIKTNVYEKVSFRKAINQLKCHFNTNILFLLPLKAFLERLNNMQMDLKKAKPSHWK